MDIKIDNKTILRILALTTLFIGVVMIANMVKTQLIWLGIAFFLALALEPSVKHFSKYMPKKSRLLALLLVFTFLIAVIAFVIVSLAPPLVSETTQLVKDAPTYADNFLNSNNFIANYLNTHDLGSQISKNQGQYFQNAVNYSGTALGVLGSIFNSIFGLITILVFTFYMVLEGPKLMAAFWKYQPDDKRAHRQELAKKMHRTVTDYINGNLMTSVIAAVSTTIVLVIVGLPYTIALGILVGIFDFIPLIGATLAAIVVTILALIFGSVTKALIVLAFFLVYQQIENNVLQPLVYSKSVKISPLVVGIAGLLGAIIAGLIGALVAIPLAASLQILVRDYFETRGKSPAVESGTIKEE